MKIEVFQYVTPCYMVNTNVSAVLAPSIFGVQEERTVSVSKTEATRSTGTSRRLFISQVLNLHKVPYLRIMLFLCCMNWYGVLQLQLHALLTVALSEMEVSVTPLPLPLLYPPPLREIIQGF